MTSLPLNRRHALLGLVAISSAGALSACIDNSNPTVVTKANLDTKFASENAFFSGKEMALLSAISGTIIPLTDTAGAVEAGVPETLQALASEWGDDAYRTYWRKGLRNLDAKMVGFRTLDKAERETVLGDYDAKVFSGEIDNQFYRDMKNTIARAYYMSEPGASEELAYEAVPGDWKGCVPLSEYPKAWAT